MDHRVDEILNCIGDAYRHKISKGGRHYLEVSVANQARRLGYADITEKFRNAYAIIPLKHPESGMKARIDGRTFVDYAQYSPGIAVPGYVARQATLAFTPFVAQDSMICNFSR